MWTQAFKQFIKDCKYPFGTPEESRLEVLIPTEQERVALRNILHLTKERIWIARGRDASGTHIEKFKDLMSNDQSNLADQCVQYIELYLKRVDTYAQEKENNS